MPLVVEFTAFSNVKVRAVEVTAELATTDSSAIVIDAVPALRTTMSQPHTPATEVDETALWAAVALAPVPVPITDVSEETQYNVPLLFIDRSVMALPAESFAVKVRILVPTVKESAASAEREAPALRRTTSVSVVVIVAALPVKVTVFAA